MADAASPVPKTEISRFDILPRPLKAIVLILTVCGIGLFVLYVFGWAIGRWVLEDLMYYYLLYAIFGPCVYLCMPARKKDKERLPWYDLAIAPIPLAICLYLALNTFHIQVGWVPPPDAFTLAMALTMIPIAMESGRRFAGWPFSIIMLIFGVYPLFAEHLPGILYGFGMDIRTLAGNFAYGRMGMLGLGARVMGEILLGYLVFAGMLLASGAGTFFIRFALALMGRYRGGPAKVAVLASGFFGSLSGTPVINVATTGAITIPAMKRMGYPPHYAGAIEAVASTGGSLMPPVMGTTVFIMVIVTGISYASIIMAAIIPALLYYYGLVVQVDSYAARVGLKGLPREEIPSVWRVLKEGWQYVIVVIFLVFGLLYMRWGAIAPVYASAMLFVLSFLNRETRMTPKKIVSTLAQVNGLITYIMAIMMPMGLLMIGMQQTGSLTALTAQIVTLGGTNVPVILLMAVVICYLFGMVGMALIPYIVLAVTAIPTLVQMTGLNLLALHLFVYCWLLTGPLTPPVCFSAFVGAAMAGAPPFKTGFTAMRLAVVLYFIPFFFVFNPALVLEGPITETLYLFGLCLVGIWILASGLEGYLLRVGRLELWSRILLVAGGFLIAFPGYGQILTWWMTSIIGAAITVLTIALIWLRRKAGGEKAVATEATG